MKGFWSIKNPAAVIQKISLEADGSLTCGKHRIFGPVK